MRCSVGGCVLKSEVKPAGGERLDDEHVRRRRIGVERHGLRRRFDLPERADQAVRSRRRSAAPPASASNSRDREMAV